MECAKEPIGTIGFFKMGNPSPVPLRLQRKGFSISFNAIDESMIKEMTTKPDYRDGRRESGKLVVKE